MVPDADYNLQIETPENLMLEAQIAGFGARSVAALLDYLLLFFVLIFVNYILVQATSGISGISESILIGVFFLFQFALFTFYHLFFEFLWNGQTPGKRFLGIRVVQNNGLPVTTTGVIVRNLVRIFDFFPFFYGIGLLVMFISKRSQRFGDMAARTLVVYEDRKITLRSLKEGAAIRYRYVPPEAEIPAYIDIGALSAMERQTVFNFLERRDQLNNASQVEQMLLAKLAAKMKVENVSFADRTQRQVFLELVARAIERERTG